VDSRPLAEFRRNSIPGAYDCPSAELPYRMPDFVRSPETTVVVNCGGRTRSIIGAQVLINAGFPNPVYALRDGTQGWKLAGLQLNHGRTETVPPPSATGRAWALQAAERVALRFGIRRIDQVRLQQLRREAARTLYLLDVRTREEFEKRRIAGSRHAPGGQLVQATDEFVGVRNARIVLIDPSRVRSVMTASWLNQMGWDDVHVLEPEGADGFAGWPLEQGPRRRDIALPPAATLSATELAPLVAKDAVCVIDLATSLRYRARHVPGAWWAVRARLAEAKAKIPAPARLVLSSEDGVLATLAAPEAAALWPEAEILVLDGGSAAWFAAGLPTESGVTRATTTLDDVWYKPYDHEHESDYEKHARAYLSWEVALVEQIKRDPTIRFRAYD
ncbi:MAG TPA: rhodanese-like domain-containing protein, partial [Burkholderiales bacterium]|nr:rhodanese-like domain-containing protein [Burkholderiales bacterium]